MPTKIGFRNLRYCLMVNEDTETYASEVKSMGKTTAFKIEPQSNTAELYADDGLAESSTVVNKANLTITIANMTQEVEADLFGHTVDAVNGGLIVKNSDVAPYVAVYGEKTMSDGTYKPFWLPKVKFTQPNDDNATKGENIEFRTLEFSGTAYSRQRDGVMKHSVSSNDSSFDAATYKVKPYEVPEAVSVTSIALNKSTAALAVGGEEELTVTFTPTGATNKNVTWFSTDTSKATVDQNGKVKAIENGEVTIVAVTNDGKKTANCVVTIS